MDHFQRLLASCSDYKPVETWRIQLLDTIQAVFYDRKNIFIYDSLNKKTLHNQHKQFLEKLFPIYDFEKNPVKFPTVQRQPNYNFCDFVITRNRAKKRYRYTHDLENNRAKRRYRYTQDLENNRGKKRRYEDNLSSCKWLYNKRYYEKRKSISSLVKQNRDTAKNIIKIYEKFWSRNYIKYYNPEAIKNIFNKLDIKNNVEKQLEAEKIVLRCMQIRDKYVRDMYKILDLLKKKSEVCLILATKCKTIDEKLIAFYGKSKHTVSSENYFIDGTYRNISSSQVLAMTMEGQVTNVLPLIEAQAKKSWLCDNNLCKIDAFLIDCYEKSFKR
ncbi:hypothetical protein ALC57_15686 [Trachymyrmex cornetzi]|uniref:Uncharacterized protein n=1 Tax=Trachymyrmex cornetzi TaxID=471704 RepID=A0A151IWI3_9HYME|nr:hypothetical protein ALC57_15686 [Trachymyrmex cornetzi]